MRTTMAEKQTSKILVAPRITENAHAWYSKHFETHHQGISMILESFPYLYRRCLKEMRGKFSLGELSLIIDVMNGVAINHELAGKYLIHNVDDGIVLDELDSKWEVDGSVLMEKLDSMMQFHLFVLEIWAIGYWKSKAYEEDDGFKEWCKDLL